MLRMVYKKALFVFLILFCNSCVINYPVFAQTDATTYYVSINGSDTNSGTSENQPWQTLNKVSRANLQPGDKVLFKRGDLWSGSNASAILDISVSGDQSKPILYGTYGTGNRPIFINTSTNSGQKKIIQIRASHVIVEGLLIKNQVVGNGIEISGSGNIIRDVEITNVMMGINLSGPNNLVTQNYIHDLVLPPDSPYGAVAINDTSINNEISYNRIINCKGPSNLFGEDGGAVELYGITDGTYIHHNWIENNRGFLEGGSNPIALGEIGHADNVRIVYNIGINNGGDVSLHLNTVNYSDEPITISNFRVENNTFIETNIQKYTELINFSVAPNPNTFFLNNNIFSLSCSTWCYVSKKLNMIHDYNLFHFTSDIYGQPGFVLNVNEKNTDPLFINRSNYNFHLNGSSPAIGAGVNLGYLLDFDNKSVPIGSPPDIGAYEFLPTVISSSSPSPIYLKGDINKDHVVNIQDYILLSNAFGTSNAAADLNSDGTVNVQDYILLSNNFGKSS